MRFEPRRLASERTTEVFYLSLRREAAGAMDVNLSEAWL